MNTYDNLVYKIIYTYTHVREIKIKLNYIKKCNLILLIKKHSNIFCDKTHFIFIIF